MLNFGNTSVYGPLQCYGNTSALQTNLKTHLLIKTEVEKS